MPRVTILRREVVVHSAVPGRFENMVAVTYSVGALSQRIVYLPLTSYRGATDEELAANPRYELLPADQKAEVAEKQAIQHDLQQPAPATFATFDVP